MLVLNNVYPTIYHSMGILAGLPLTNEGAVNFNQSCVAFLFSLANNNLCINDPIKFARDLL